MEQFIKNRLYTRERLEDLFKSYPINPGNKINYSFTNYVRNESQNESQIFLRTLTGYFVNVGA